MADKNSTKQVDALKNGTITEVLPDDTHNLWGQIVGWEPKHYVAFTWHPNGPEDEATIVAVLFQQTKDGPQLNLTLDGFDLLGEMADAVSTSYLSDLVLVVGSFRFATSTLRVPPQS